jgi:hypothetical protein
MRRSIEKTLKGSMRTIPQLGAVLLLTTMRLHGEDAILSGSSDTSAVKVEGKGGETSTDSGALRGSRGTLDLLERQFRRSGSREQPAMIPPPVTDDRRDKVLDARARKKIADKIDRRHEWMLGGPENGKTAVEPQVNQRLDALRGNAPKPQSLMHKQAVANFVGPTDLQLDPKKANNPKNGTGELGKSEVDDSVAIVGTERDDLSKGNPLERAPSDAARIQGLSDLRTVLGGGTVKGAGGTAGSGVLMTSEDADLLDKERSKQLDKAFGVVSSTSEAAKSENSVAALFGGKSLSRREQLEQLLGGGEADKPNAAVTSSSAAPAESLNIATERRSLTDVSKRPDLDALFSPTTGANSGGRRLSDDRDRDRRDLYRPQTGLLPLPSRNGAIP